MKLNGPAPATNKKFAKRVFHPWRGATEKGEMGEVHARDQPLPPKKNEQGFWVLSAFNWACRISDGRIMSGCTWHRW